MTLRQKTWSFSNVQTSPSGLTVVHVQRFLLLISLCFLASCDGTRPVSEATEEGILLLGNGAEPKALDLQLIADVSSGNIARALFEGLVIDDVKEDSVARPGAAERWESNDDFTVWTFHLRPGTKWSDGVPVTSHDFLFAYQRMLEPAFAARYASMLYYIKGAEAFNKGETTDFSTVGLRAPDDLTLEVTLRSPIPFLPEITKHTTWYPVPKHCVLEHGKMTDRFTDWTKTENIVCNGPFVLKQRRVMHSVEVVKNPNYWDADTVRLKGINFYPVTNTYTESRMFFDGLLHKTDTLPAEIISLAKKDTPDLLHIDPYVGVRFIRCNTQHPLLKNKDFRMALAYSIDRKRLVETITQGGEVAAYGMVPPFGNYETPNSVNFDPDKAREYLKKANVGDLGSFPKLRFLTTSRDTARRNAEAFQAMWQETLGIGVRIEQLDWSTFQERERQGQYDLSAGGWIGDFLDPTTFLDMWRPGDGNNKTYWENPSYIDALTKAETTGDPVARMKVLEQAESVLMSDMPVIPTYWYSKKSLMSPDVRNWNPLLLNNQPFKHVYLEASN